MDDALRKVEHALLVVAIAVGAFYAHMYDKQKAIVQQKQLAAQTLPADVLAQYTLQQNKLIELVRNAQGKTVAKTAYVPEEGGIQVIAKKQDALAAQYQALLDQLKLTKSTAAANIVKSEIAKVDQEMQQPPEIKVTDWGFTSRFGYGLATALGHSINYAVTGGSKLDLPFSPMIDWKFFYFHRYSAEVQANLFYAGPEFSRHLDDLTPKFMHVNNTEAAISFGPGWTGGWTGGLNLRSNF